MNSLLVRTLLESSTLEQEALKYGTVEEFVKSRPETFYHSGSEISGKLKKGRYNAFYVTDVEDYAKSYGGKDSKITKFYLDKESKILDMTNLSEDELSSISNGIDKELNKPHKYGRGFSLHPYTKSSVMSGLKERKAYFAELPQIKTILSSLGYDGQITNEVGRAKNIGVWNMDILTSESQLKDIWNQAHGVGQENE